MDTKLLEHLQCPICLETLKKPIRGLPCGHNFCQECLVQYLSPNLQKSCPTCRRGIPVGPTNVDSLSRQHTIENVIEIVSKSKQGKKPQTKATVLQLSGDALKQLNELARANKRNGDYKEAISTFQTIISQEKGSNKIPPMIEKAECHLQCGQHEETQIACVEISSLVTSIQPGDIPQNLRNQCVDGLKKLSDQLLENKDCDTAILIIQSRCSFIKAFYSGESCLIKLRLVVYDLMSAAKEMMNQSKVDESKQQIAFMEEIVEAMQQITDVDLKVKIKQVAKAFGHIGFCCNEVKDYNTSMRINTAAMELYKAAFGDEARQDNEFGVYHNNLAVALNCSNQLEKSKEMYVKAIEIYKVANDWSSEEEKNNEISITNNNLDKLIKKLSTL